MNPNDLVNMEPNTPNVVFDRAQLERAIDDKTSEIFGQFNERLESELYPLLYQMKQSLPHGEWIFWFERYKNRSHLKLSLRTVQRRFKALENPKEDVASVDEEQKDAGEIVHSERREEALEPVATVAQHSSPRETLKKLLHKIKTTLQDGTAPVDADPLRDADNRIDKVLGLVEDTQLAIQEGLLDGQNRRCKFMILVKDWNTERGAASNGWVSPMPSCEQPAVFTETGGWACPHHQEMVQHSLSVEETKTEDERPTDD